MELLARVSFSHFKKFKKVSVSPKKCLTRHLAVPNINIYNVPSYFNPQSTSTGAWASTSKCLLSVAQYSDTSMIIEQNIQIEEKSAGVEVKHKSYYTCHNPIIVVNINSFTGPLFFDAQKIGSSSTFCLNFEHSNDKSNSKCFIDVPVTALFSIFVNRCWKVIEDETEAAVKSDEFETIEKPLLEAVVSTETLTIEEVDLFTAVDLWANKQCEKQGLAADDKMKRRILGEEIVKSIRFPLMKQEEFAGVVLDTKILTPDEVIMLVKYFNSKLTSPMKFLTTRRRSRVIRNCARASARVSWLYNGVDKNLFCFEVNKDITLHGLCLSGSENSSYTVTLEVKDTSNNLTVVSKSGTYLSKLLQCTINSCQSCYRFEVLFDSAAFLKKNCRYKIEALISGPFPNYKCSELSFFGQGIPVSQVVSDVKFRFFLGSLSFSDLNCELEIPFSV